MLSIAYNIRHIPIVLSISGKVSLNTRMNSKLTNSMEHYHDNHSHNYNIWGKVHSMGIDINRRVFEQL